MDVIDLKKSSSRHRVSYPADTARAYRAILHPSMTLYWLVSLQSLHVLSARKRSVHWAVIPVLGGYTV